MSFVREGDGSAPPAPLVEIERRVTERAKQLALDLDERGVSSALRSLVDDEIRQWDEDHRRGTRPHALVDPDLVAERALRNVAGFGPLAPLLEDDDVWEIMINAPDGGLCEYGTTNRVTAAPAAPGFGTRRTHRRRTTISSARGH